MAAEAACAKGVLHRHFADFDAFLAELVLDRIGRLQAQSAALRDSAGTGTVAGNLAGALTDVFGPVAVSIVGRAAPTGVPLLTEATAMIADYLAAERKLGRIAPDADVDTLARTLLGSGHLLFAARDGIPPDAGAVDRVVITTLSPVLQNPAP